MCLMRHTHPRHVHAAPLWNVCYSLSDHNISPRTTQHPPSPIFSLAPLVSVPLADSKRLAPFWGAKCRYGCRWKCRYGCR